MLKKPLIPLFIFLLFAVIIFFARNTPPINLVSGVIQNIFSTPRSILFNIRGENEISDIKKIKEENVNLTKILVDFEKIRRDNEALRSQFESTDALQYNLIPAEILGYDGNFTNPNTLVINVGQTSGVKQGMAVVSKNNLIGKIERVSPKFSKVILITNSKFTTLAKTSDTNSKGVIVGSDDFLLLDRVSVNDKLNKNSLVSSVGDLNSEEVGIPPNFIIGKITSVNRSQNLPFQNAKVERILKYSDLEMVFVVKGIK